MALKTVVYPQTQGHFGYYGRRDDTYALPWSWCDTAASGFGDAEPCAGEWDPLLLASLVHNAEERGEEVGSGDASPASAADASAPPPVMQQHAATTRRKRRRTKMVKDEEEIESQRMTHIAVERNRRRQMNEYLAVLRSLMPPSYAKRSDQASIVGGAINHVRELEHLLQSLEVQKSLMDSSNKADEGSHFPFARFFSFPQYSTTSSSHESCNRIQAESTATADIEVTVVEGHASLKVQVQQRPRQLLRLTAGLHQLGLTTLHLNVCTAGSTAMYSFTLKLEEECELTSVEEIAAAAHGILGRIQEEQAFVDTKTGF